MRSDEYVCAGCDGIISGVEAGSVWCDTPMGMTSLRVHKTQACGKAALERHPEYKMRKGNRPPLSQEERAREEGP